MKNYSESIKETHNENLWELNYHKEKPVIIHFDLLAGVKEDYRFPSFDELLTDLQKSEADLGIYQQLGKYSKILNRV